MADRSEKIQGAIKRMLSEDGNHQLSLFGVSDLPMRKAIFEETPDDLSDTSNADETSGAPRER